MQRDKVVRFLRIAVSAVWGILCVLLICLWVRSYWKCDIVSRVNNSGRLTTIGSNSGYVYLIRMQFPKFRGQPNGGPGWGSSPHGWRIGGGREATNIPAVYKWKSTPMQTQITVPYRYFVPLLAVFAALPWLRWKFSLRTLLIATTAIAVVLGLVVWGMRN